MADKTIAVYRGVPVKDHPMIRIRVSQFEFKKFVDAKLDLGLGAREFLEYSGKPCNHCVNTEVIIYNKKDQEIKIKRGVLCKK